MYLGIYTCTYMNALKQYKNHEFERRQRGTCGRDWREEREERNVIIKL